MEERVGVLVQNEKHANKSVAKVMRITFLIFSIVFLSLFCFFISPYHDGIFHPHPHSPALYIPRFSVTTLSFPRRC